MKKEYIYKFYKSISSHFFLIAISLMTIIPIITCLFASSKSDAEFAATSKIQPPDNWLYFDNYLYIINNKNFIKAFFITIGLAVAAAMVSVMLTAMLAYALNRLKFKGAKIIQYFVLIFNIVPAIMMQVSVYKSMLFLNLVNTLHGYIILMSGINIIPLYIFMQYFKNTPTSYDDDALLNGCSYIGAFFRIHIPMMLPAIVTAVLIEGIYVFNDYYLSGLYLQDKDKFATVSNILYSFTGPYGNKYNLISAGVIMSIIPMLIIFMIFQKRIYNSINGTLHI